MSKRYVRPLLAKGLLSSAVFIACLFFAAAASYGEQEDILVVGEGVIKNNNLAGARKEAISDALKSGIEQYLSRYLGRQGVAGNFSALINDIVPNGGDDIENYHILAENRKNDVCSLFVSVKVNEQLMEQRLKDYGIVSIETSSVKILFLVSQEISQEEGPSFWWNYPEDNPAMTTTELTLYNILQEMGMEPIDRLYNIPFTNYSEDMTVQYLSDEAALEWGRAFSADIIIKGSCSVYENTISVDLEAIKVDSGDSLCRALRKELIIPDETASEDGMGSQAQGGADLGYQGPGGGQNFHITANDERFTDALHSAIYNIAVQFVPQIVKSFEKTDGESSKIPVKIDYADDFEEFRLVTKFLESDIYGVKSVVQSRIKGNSMTVIVDFYGTRDEFINRLKGKRLPVQADITDTAGDEIVISIEHEILDPMSDRYDFMP